MVVSVVDVPAEFYGESPGAWDNLVTNARGFVEKIAQQAEASGVRTETMVKEAETWKSIVALAEEHKADTIIMGSHGRTGLKRLLMGSVTEKVIGNAPCPVLVIKGM
jgi:nucleotide-binding universal stress UspA family protein